ncbi:MAG: hypothetical protein Q3X94_01035 [Oscillospiraceae bacterium]|nr:hypothetical protein [Oscillospiraceae bacterium]
MRSVTSCFNAMLFRKNLTRFWPLWTMASLLAILPPLALATELVRGYGSRTPLSLTDLYYSAISTAAPIVLLFYAVLCALAVWGYLFGSRSVGMLHSMPITRKGLFLTNALSGLVMTLIPWVVCGVFFLVISLVFGLFDPVGLGVTVLSVLGLSLFYFASATLCAFLTGNVFAMPAFYFVLHFIAMILETLISALVTLCFFGTTAIYMGRVDFLSPTVWLVRHLSVDRVYQDVWVAGSEGGGYTDQALTAVHLIKGWAIGAYALVGLALLVCAWLLYRRRASECAGDVVAVGWMKPVFRYGVTFLAALAGGQALYALFWYDAVSWKLIPLLGCMLVSGAIGYYVASMLLAKSLKVFRGSWKGLAAMAAVLLALCLGLRFDVAGVERFVPAPDQVEQVELYLDENNYTLTAEKDGAIIQQVLALHQAVVDDKGYIQSQQSKWYTDGISEDQQTTYLRLNYVLADGSALSRAYHLPLSRDRMDQEGTYDALVTALVEEDSLKHLRLHLDETGDLTDGWTTEGVWVWNDMDGEGLDGTSRDADAVLAALAQDIAAGNWGSPSWSKDAEDRYVVSLEIRYIRTGEWTEDRAEDRAESDSITISLRPEMTHTVETLLELGLVQDSDLITWADWNAEDGGQTHEMLAAPDAGPGAEVTPLAEGTAVTVIGDGVPAQSLRELVS